MAPEGASLSPDGEPSQEELMIQKRKHSDMVIKSNRLTDEF